MSQRRRQISVLRQSGHVWQRLTTPSWQRRDMQHLAVLSCIPINGYVYQEEGIPATSHIGQHCAVGLKMERAVSRRYLTTKRKK